MKKILLTILSINLSTIHSPSLSDTNITVNFTGNIKAATCNISGGSNIDIDLKRLSIDTFNGAQTGSAWNHFNINLNNCSSFVNQIRLTFTGTAENGDTTNSLYKNLGTAKNISVQLQSDDGATPLGDSKVLQVPLNGKSDIAIPLRTRAYSLMGNVVPGSISANITATITYL